MFETLKESRILRQRPPHSLRGRLIMGTGLGGTSRTHVFCLSLPKTRRFVNSSPRSTNETFDPRDEILAQGHIAMSLESAPRSVWAWAEPPSVMRLESETCVGTTRAEAPQRKDSRYWVRTWGGAELGCGSVRLWSLHAWPLVFQEPAAEWGWEKRTCVKAQHWVWGYDTSPDARGREGHGEEEVSLKSREGLSVTFLKGGVVGRQEWALQEICFLSCISSWSIGSVGCRSRTCH